jgi:aspartate kinase
MGLIVQKFGGTSVADSEKIQAAARKAIRAQRDGNRVVVVVSAMGHNTDHLIDLAHQVSDNPPAREMDMLLSTGEQVSVALMAMAVHALGAKAVSLTGAQIGIHTDSSYTKARIRKISTERIRQLLDEGNIVIAAGFQGIDENYNITTLGRGGSDTTAVALAAVLHADACEIFTDVDGVYTTDPRQLPEARQMSQISYDEMLELASLGAGVMHNRSIEFAKKFGVPIRVRSSFSDVEGTMIVDQPESDAVGVCGAAISRNESRAHKLNVDMIVQNLGEEGYADLSFTVPREELKTALQAIEQARAVLGDIDVTYDDAVAKISVVGLGMARQTGVAQKMFHALAAANVNIQMITTSEIKISVLVQRGESLAALRAVHQAFELHEKPPQARVWTGHAASSGADADVGEVVERLRALDMEQLTLEDIELSGDQARVTLVGVPDQPGLADAVFQAVADSGIFVDMIVQTCDGYQGDTSISFTVPEGQLERCRQIVENLPMRFRKITTSKQIAKLSVSGIGLRSHTSVAIGMFRALAEAGINVQMINTSELRVNVVVEEADAQRGLAQLRAVFSEALI